MQNPLLSAQQPFTSVEELEHMETKRKENDKNRVELADKITTLMEYPEWKFLEKEFDNILKFYKQDPIYYANNPNMSWYHAGIVFIVEQLKDWTSEQKEIINDPKYSK